MTSITNLTALSLSAGAQSGLGAEFILAAGIMGRAMRPLGASQRAFAQLPGLWNVALLSGAAAQPAASWTATTGANGQASIDLGDGYTLQLNERNSQITILNANSGETTRIWGDPHVEVNGKHVFDFAGTTTFTLGNGTKITIDTEQYARNPDAYVASKVTITRGDQAIVVNGISQNRLGDLSISMSNDGALIDAMTRDGFTLHEDDAASTGWDSGFTGQAATQADLNITMPGRAYGPGSTLPSIEELGTILSGFLLFGVAMGLAVENGNHAAARAMANAFVRAG